jgi:outer membrane protein assembly factor BamB
VIYRGAIYQLAGNGQLYSLDQQSGKVRWRRKIGTLAASSPAVAGGTVYATLLDTRGPGTGRVIALRLKDGSVRWSRSLRSRSESSPLLHRGRLYIGTEDGTVLGLNAHNGRTIWRYRAAGAVKGSPTLSGRNLYFGDYGGHVHAVRRADGKPIWNVAPARRVIGGGRFYATAAVAFGRVYIGSTDGRQYSLSAQTGRLAWARQTGHYVYSSAAVHNVSDLGPTVYFGSYDGRFYALDARSGKTRWTFRSGGKISGSPTIVGDTVYFSDIGRHRTYGLGIRTGRVVFKRGFGAFDPIVSDGRHLYLTGHSSLTALLPRSDPEGRARAAAERRRVARKKTRKAARRKAERRKAHKR